VRLLGPNGAAKTTAVRILATLSHPDAGEASVAGADVVREPRQVRRRIGLVGQNVSVDEILTGRQNLELFGRLGHLPARAFRWRAADLLDQFGLATATATAADRPVGRDAPPARPGGRAAARAGRPLPRRSHRANRRDQPVAVTPVRRFSPAGRQPSQQRQNG
jgi:ABC-type glutathione transport system ATPase component